MSSPFIMRYSAFRNIICSFITNSFMKQRKQVFFCTQAAKESTVQEVKSRLIKLMGVDLSYKPIQGTRAHLLSLLPQSQDELPECSMQDSFTSAIIPLSTDNSLQDKYVTFLGSVRVGRLLEDMDMFSVWVAHKHINNPRMKPDDVTPYVIVTILVDQINFTDIVPRSDADIRLSGHVSWVGRSSIETVVWLEQDLHGKWQKLTRAVFLMAARDSTNTGAAPINRLVPQTDREREIFSGGEDRKRRRIKQQSTSLLRTIPDSVEQRIIHDLFLQTVDLNSVTFDRRVLPPGSIWMEDAKISNIIFSQPEDRNLHNNVFGGFLMRQATELAWTNGYLHSKYRPTLSNISDITFHKPVNVGSLLRMHSHVVFTQQNYMQIAVYAEVFHASADGHPVTTNVFHFTFKVPEVVMKVVPRTYHEAMMYLDGRRRFLHALELENK